jgi:photosystem II stability/assembly factor-like uncharacterized protein
MLKANRYVPILIDLSVVVAAAQTGQKEKPKFKAIWEPVNYPYDAELRDVYFVSAEEGWVVGHASSDAGEGGVILHTTDGGEGKFFATADGGQTWRGIPQQFPVGPIRFAAPQVGWVVRGGSVIYTSDGGKRWGAAQVRFPADAFSSSLPTHDRGYVVGNHGMIYRYRIVPIEYSSKGMLPAAAITAK